MFFFTKHQQLGREARFSNQTTKKTLCTAARRECGPEQMFEQTSSSSSPWIAINANNKMIARLSALRFLLNQTEYENKKLLTPLTWSKKINNYKVLLEGVEFKNLDYDQYKVLSKYMDDE